MRNHGLVRLAKVASILAGMGCSSLAVPANSAPARASTTAGQWACTYPDFSPAHKPAIVHYRRASAGLEEISPSLLPQYGGQHIETYRIAWENDDAILAVNPGIDVDRDDKRVAYAFVVLINKRSGDYTRNAIVSPDDLTTNPRAQGSCVAE